MNTTQALRYKARVSAQGEEGLKELLLSLYPALTPEALQALHGHIQRNITLVSGSLIWDESGNLRCVLGMCVPAALDEEYRVHIRGFPKEEHLSAFFLDGEEASRFLGILVGALDSHIHALGSGRVLSILRETYTQWTSAQHSTPSSTLLLPQNAPS